MSITIQSSMLPQVDPEESLAFYRDVLGFELRLDVGYGGMRWLTLGAPGQPDTSVVLYPAGVNPGLTDDEQATVRELVAKGTLFSINLAADDVDDAFARVEASGADVIQEPIDQDYGLRDCAFRDPAGNTVRLQQRK